MDTKTKDLFYKVVYMVTVLADDIEFAKFSTEEEAARFIEERQAIKNMLRIAEA